MITSSINEFSNPAYNGPSALDGDSAAEGKRTIMNGDYAKAKALDFDLITETRATPDVPDTNEQNEDYKGDATQEDSSTGTTKDEDAKDADKVDRGLQMGIGDASGAGVSDMDVDVAVAASMDGIETEDASKGQDGQTKSNDIQVDSETDGGMDVDVDQS